MRMILFTSLRLVALLLCILSVQRAWAGWEVYMAETDIKAGHVKQGLERLERTLTESPLNPQAYDLYGRTLQHYLTSQADNPVPESAKQFFEKMTELFPYYGRSWLYRAQADGGTSPEYEEWLRTALQKEPTSGWMNYAVGVLMLTENQQLSPEDIVKGLKKIRQGTSVRFKGQTSHSLEAALEFLWNRFENFKYLEYVTPKDRISYGVLRKFLIENEIQKHLPYVHDKYQKITKIDYKKYIEKGKVSLASHNYEDALKVFTKAYWMDQYGIPARVGKLIAQHALDQSEDVDTNELREILESENVPMLKSLQPVMHKAVSPYIVGLYKYQRGDYKEAIKAFQRVTDEDARRNVERRLAIAYWKAGDKINALKLITHELAQEKPDLVSLGWWAQLDTPFRTKLLSRLELLAHNEIAQTKWVTEDQKTPSFALKGPGRLGTIVPFKPGPVELQVEVKGIPDDNGRYPYLMFGFWDNYRLQPIKEYSFSSQNWNTVSLKFETSGGYRWLWIQSVESKKTNAGFEIGNTKVIYPNE